MAANASPSIHNLGASTNSNAAAAAVAAVAGQTTIVDGISQTSSTEIRVERVTHHWTVKNFSHCYQEYLENFVHLVKGDDALTWSIKIYPKGNGENNKDFVFLCLNRLLGPPSSKFNKVGFKSRFILRNAENKEIEMRVHPNPSHSDYVCYVKRDVLFPQILPQDLIQVTVEIEVAVETVTVNTSDNQEAEVPDSLRIMAGDYSKLLKTGMCSDFEIQVGSQRIPVHRSVLVARSSVLAAMLSHETEEQQQGFVKIADIDHEVVQEMLEFIYSGECPRLSELGGELLVAADKYSLQDLKTRCEQALIQAINCDNVCELLILSDVHSAATLRAKAVEYITQNSLQVTKTTGWDVLVKQHPQLITEVVQSFAPKQSTSSSANDIYIMN